MLVHFYSHTLGKELQTSLLNKTIETITELALVLMETVMVPVGLYWWLAKTNKVLMEYVPKHTTEKHFLMVKS